MVVQVLQLSWLMGHPPCDPPLPLQRAVRRPPLPPATEPRQTPPLAALGLPLPLHLNLVPPTRPPGRLHHHLHALQLLLLQSQPLRLRPRLLLPQLLLPPLPLPPAAHLLAQRLLLRLPPVSPSSPFGRVETAPMQPKTLQRPLLPPTHQLARRLPLLPLLLRDPLVHPRHSTNQESRA